MSSASRPTRLAHQLTAMEAILMRALGVISTTALFLLLGTALPAFAQDEHHEPEAKPAQHEEPAKPAQQEEKAKPAQHEEQAKPEKQAAEAKPAKQEKQAKPEKQEAQAKPEKQATEAKPAKQEKQAKPEKQEAEAKPATQEKQAKPEKQAAQSKSEKQPQAKQLKQEGRSNAAGSPQRTAAQEQRQRAEPALRLSVRGSGRIPDDRFRANFGESHTFVINEPVLVGGYSRFQYSGFWFGFVEPWPDGWYYTDNVYVDYVDGEYFLINPYYPGARVGISVIL